MSYVNLEVTDKIATITLDRPPANALNLAMYADIKAAVERINLMVDDVGAAVMRSTGKIFVAGNDIAEFMGVETPEDIVEYTDHVSECMNTVYTCRVPVVAAVQGPAVGGGLALAASCDVIVASERAAFGVPEIKVGLIGCGDFFRLMVPEKVARYASYTGQMIPAQQVHQYGGVHEVVPVGEEYDEAVKVAREFLKVPPRALEYFKQAMNVTADRQLKEKYRTEIGFSEKHVLCSDFKEAVNSFLEKRPPVFTGH